MIKFVFPLSGIKKVAAEESRYIDTESIDIDGPTSIDPSASYRDPDRYYRDPSGKYRGVPTSNPQDPSSWRRYPYNRGDSDHYEKAGIVRYEPSTHGFWGYRTGDVFPERRVGLLPRILYDIKIGGVNPNRRKIQKKLEAKFWPKWWEKVRREETGRPEVNGGIDLSNSKER